MSQEAPPIEINLSEEIARHFPVQPAGEPIVPQILKTALFALIIFLIARLLILPYQVDGRSMDPNLVDRERVLVNRAIYTHFDLDRWLGWVPGIDVASTSFFPFRSPSPGDVVVLNPPESSEAPFIKRTIAVAGDTVTIRNGFVFVNGVQIEEHYINGAITGCNEPAFCTNFVVPEGMIYVLGDNRQHSFDSRSFGPIPLDNVIGQAWFANWPADRFGFIPSYDYKD